LPRHDFCSMRHATCDMSHARLRTTVKPSYSTVSILKFVHPTQVLAYKNKSTVYHLAVNSTLIFVRALYDGFNCSPTKSSAVHCATIACLTQPKRYVYLVYCCYFMSGTKRMVPIGPFLAKKGQCFITPFGASVPPVILLVLRQYLP
jgi:hypothetical protein